MGLQIGSDLALDQCGATQMVGRRVLPGQLRVGGPGSGPIEFNPFLVTQGSTNLNEYEVHAKSHLSKPQKHLAGHFGKLSRQHIEEV